MVSIDLHGLKHSQVESILANWLINQYNLGIRDFEIITGNSDQMKNLVYKICKEHGFKIDNSWNKNTASLILSCVNI